MDSLKNFMLNPLPSRKDVFYVTVAVWILAIVFEALSWVNASDPTDTDKQKKYNLYQSITILSLILGMYLTICLVQ